MCIIIDACAFSSVFNAHASDHDTYKPLLDWIVSGNGKIVYGGEKYRSELKYLTKYLRFIIQLKKAGKVVEIDDARVNEEQNIIENIIDPKRFNDAHLVAIVRASGCLLICTKEREAIPFIKDSSLYPKGVKKPRLYTQLNNRKLLCDRNIAEICLPKEKGSKELINLFKT